MPRSHANTPSILPQLQRAPCLIENDLLRQLAESGDSQDFAVDELLIREGEPSYSIYILLSGRVKVFGSDEHDSNREVVYNLLGPGEFLGEMCLDGGSRSASVAAIEPTRCVVVDRERLRDFMATHPDFALTLVNKLIQRVRHSTEYIKSLALDDVYQRTVRLLHGLASVENGRVIVAETLTQQAIAERVGASREMINKIFKQLTVGGYLGKEGKRIVLLKRLPERW